MRNPIYNHANEGVPFPNAPISSNNYYEESEEEYNDTSLSEESYGFQDVFEEQDNPQVKNEAPNGKTIHGNAQANERVHVGKNDGVVGNVNRRGTNANRGGGGANRGGHRDKANRKGNANRVNVHNKNWHQRNARGGRNKNQHAQELEDSEEQVNMEAFASAIMPPPIHGNVTFNTPQVIIQGLDQNGLFSGRKHDDPTEHLRNFVQTCHLYNSAHCTEESLHLRVFSYSLSGKAKAWLNKLPKNSIHTREELVRKLLTKFFPKSKQALMRDKVYMFKKDPYRFFV